ncbi:lysophospholipid acyltransferase 6 isoform X1 [Danaus plexippus]|uniref:lysophospholipid acyltransferase 6 isoform X1 n=2 Tax=Danaus plexippus TaxID=13037 RepID=UPI002AB1269A|nr:lysophospholipid acyltransferase 6 isoform X1 [Danaus plexippus]XP_061377239.1 lysophospholipid acyltransferase 6 isoform X1 [Danaus plexippus]
MSTEYYDYYDGSKLFLFLSNRLGLPIDLVNFLIAQFAALCVARLFRKPLKLASPEFRHSLCLVIGLLMGYFCFGKQAVHLSVLPMIGYILLRMLSPNLMGNAILAASMIYLSCIHLHRQIYHTADYSLDITGPLMVITQRVTSLAYSLQDKLTTKEINANSTSNSWGKDFKTDKMPSPLEYFAYTLAFQTLMCGPVVFYSDYISFIEGDHVNGEGKSHMTEREPSPRLAVLYKVAGSVAAAVLYLSLAKKYPLAVLEELTNPHSEVSRSWSALYLLWYAYLSTLVVRCKYYHAWLLSEAICNNSGMGFNGYDTNGSPKWDKMSNIDVLGFELAQNFRAAVSSWNKNTNAWLRLVAYSRGGWRTTRVYALSAIWHGFHPGYYFTFFAGGLFTVAAKKVRSFARPMFVDSKPKKMLYDALTFITTRVAMTYATVPFILLNLSPTLAFYGKFYYSLHFIALGALFLPNNNKYHTSQISNCPNTSSKLKEIPVQETIVEANGKMKVR